MRQRDEGKEPVVVDERAPGQREAKPAPLERQGDDEGRAASARWRRRSARTRLR